jgi:DnaJ-class molecular chaperone
MRYFSDDIDDEIQARLNYKRLAVMFHPDRGGDENIMREINREYDIVKRKLRKPAKNLMDVRIGDTILVNGTECKVTAVFTKTFFAKAKGRHRFAVFDRETGVALYDETLKAEPFLQDH